MSVESLAFALVVVMAGPSADVDVRPSDRSPTLVIESESEARTGAYEGASSGNAATAQPPVTCVRSGQLRACEGESVEVLMPGDPATLADIRRAVESVGLPALTVRIQPGGQTLVNVDTIFHTQAPEFRHSTVLLGQSVEITASPTKFTWHHGDGTTQTTSTPGAPYPSTAVTHRYTRVATGLTPRVDVGYRVTYRVNGGSVQEIDQLITASGPPSAIDVAEAAPVVVAP